VTPFGFRRRPHADVPDVEWFPRFADVPGINWVAPLHVAVDQRLASAHPVAIDTRDTFEGGPTYRWVDASGRAIAEPFAFHDSPTAIVTEQIHEKRPQRQLELALTALELPGTRYDYSQALEHGERVIQYEGLQLFDVLSILLRGHIALMLAGPTVALAPPWSDCNPPLERASEPFVTLMSLYRREGFLREAIDVERLIDVLPPEARPRYMPEPRPTEIAEALRGLA
jgi:hypothetical protein